MGEHYEGVASGYEAAFFYSSEEYMQHVLTHLLRHLGADETSSVVDLGGGTGNFTQRLAAALQLRRRALCVDPAADMLAQAVAHPLVEPMLLDALSFAALPPEGMRYTHALLKEVVHHIDEGAIPAMYTGIHAQLEPGGCVVSITRPQEVEYPLFERARQIWREHQPPATLFTLAMEAAGLQVEVHTADYRASLPKATWLAMMRAKFWSTFSHCTPQELEQGIAEVEAQYVGQDTVHFVDRLLLLVGRKPVAALPLQLQPSAELHPELGGGVLTQEQRQQYTRDGYVAPVQLLTAAEAAGLLQRFEEYEAQLGGTVSGDWRFKSHLLLPWVWELVHHPSLLAAVADALGCRNLLCWSTDWFVKQPGDGAYTSWHQDSTYVGLAPCDVVTVWLALTPSTTLNGCLRVLPGSQAAQLPHVDTFAEGNMLLKGQTIQGLEQQQGVPLELQPGQASLHHLRLAHCSGAAESGAPTQRVGLAIRYMAAHVRQELDPRDSVAPVAGLDTFGRYRHEQPPAAALDAVAREEHRRAVGRVYPDGYPQQANTAGGQA